MSAIDIDVDSAPTRRRRLRRVAVAAAVAAVIVRLSQDDLSDRSRWWAAIATLVMTVTLVWMVPIVQQVLAPGWAPASIVGVMTVTFLCVPETDQIPYIAAVPAVLAVVEVLSGRSLPFGVIYTAAALVLWAGVFGATGRQSAFVGAFFAWWPLMMLAGAVAICPALARARPWRHAVILIGGFVAAGVVSRTGALQPTGGPAVRAAAVAGVVSLGLTSLVLVSFRTPGDREGATPR